MNDAPLRLPDFIIIGTMKSGTTSLFRWLEMHPGCAMPSAKQTDFFTDDNWHRGLGWYADFFSSAPKEKMTGEASPKYTDPRLSTLVAERMHSTVPSARIVAVLRDPLERMRSHYRYAVQRGYESRPFLQVISDPTVTFVERSLYWKALSPYVERFPRSQICLVRFEDLYRPPHAGWSTILRFLELERSPVPTQAFNVTAGKRKFGKVFLYLWKSGILSRLRAVPKPIREMGKHLMTRDDASYRSKLKTANATIPSSIRELIIADQTQLEAWLGVEEPLWQVPSSVPQDVNADL